MVNTGIKIQLETKWPKPSLLLEQQRVKHTRPNVEFKTTPPDAEHKTYPLLGIGRAVVNYLLQVDGGHNLVLVARSKSLLDDVKSKAGGQVDVLAGDFENLSTGPKVVELAISRFGQLDGLVLNHGSLGEVERVADGDPLEWRRTFDVNFFSILACVSFLKVE